MDSISSFSCKLHSSIVNVLLPDSLLADKEALVQVLLYYVVLGNLTADKVVTFETLLTLQEQSVSIRAMNGKVMVDDANVISVDILGSNGVIHLIDKVILPE